MEEGFADREGVEFARSETVYGLTDPFDQSGQLGLVVGSDGLLGSSSVRLTRHVSRLPWIADPSPALWSSGSTRLAAK